MDNIKYILITGATRGIGKAILENLQKDYFVLFTYKNSDSIKNEIEKKYKNVKGFKIDSKNIKDIENLFKYIENNNIKLEGIINNVSISGYSLLIDLDEKEYDEMFDINVKSTVFFTKLALQNMLKNKNGNIINISSIWGIYGSSCESIYSATKGAIIAFTKSIAKEYGISGIRANVISPGACYTDMIKNFNEEEINEIKEMSYLNKLTDVNDIAKTVDFILKNNSINGENVEISGCIK